MVPSRTANETPSSAFTSPKVLRRSSTWIMRTGSSLGCAACCRVTRSLAEASRRCLRSGPDRQRGPACYVLPVAGDSSMAHNADALQHTRGGARRLRASPARRGRAATAALLVLAAAGACGRQPPVEQVVWSPGGVGRELRGAYGGGDVAQDAAGTWLAYEEETSPGEGRIRVRHLGSADLPDAPAPLLASLPGRRPHVLVQDGRPVILCSAGTAGDEFAPVLYTGSSDGRTWVRPRGSRHIPAVPMVRPAGWCARHGAR